MKKKNMEAIAAHIRQMIRFLIEQSVFMEPIPLGRGIHPFSGNVRRPTIESVIDGEMRDNRDKKQKFQWLLFAAHWNHMFTSGVPKGIPSLPQMFHHYQKTR